MLPFKDTGGRVCTEYFTKMVQAEALYEAAEKAGNRVEADRHLRKFHAYADALAAVSTTLLTK